MNKAREIVLVVLLVAIAAIPRFVGLGKFTSIDEPFWLRASGNFYYALGQRQFENTLYEYHPAVTTMWVITAGMLAYFPDYRKLEQGYLKPAKFDAFMVEHGKSMLQLLIVSRAVQVIVSGRAPAGRLFPAARSCSAAWTAFFTTALISSSRPFSSGTRVLLNHEAMLALFLMMSLLGLLVYLYVERRLSLLLLSGAAAALAQLTKSSGIVLFPVIALVIFIAALQSVQSRNRKPAPALLDTCTGLRYLVCRHGSQPMSFSGPECGLRPARCLYEVYGNALTYAFQGARLSTTPGVAPASFRLDAVVLAWESTCQTCCGVRHRSPGSVLSSGS